MTVLLSLKGGKQPALVGVHQAHDQVDLLVEGLIGVIGHASADRANTVIGMERGFHNVIIRKSILLLRSFEPLLQTLTYQTLGINRQRT